MGFNSAFKGLIRINNGGTLTLVQDCGNMTSIKQSGRRTENNELSHLRDIPHP